MSLLWLLTRMATGSLFLGLIILSIPLAFDVGGKECGLAFSLSLAVFYSILSTLRIATTSSHVFFRFQVQLLSYLQYLLVPALLIYSLHKWSPQEGGSGFLRNGFENGVVLTGHTWLEAFTLGWWAWFLKWSTPMFQLLEGFCTLLVIQTFGQISRWLVNRNRSDSWMVGFLFIRLWEFTDCSRLPYLLPLDQSSHQHYTFCGGLLPSLILEMSMPCWLVLVSLVASYSAPMALFLEEETRLNLHYL